MRRTVLIVDDHAGFRSAARRLLEAEGYDVVGEAGDAEAALADVVALEPEVVLLDVHLPELDGFAVAERLARVPTPPAIVLISSRDSARRDPRLVVSPARGFIAKAGLSGAALTELVG